MKINAKGIVPTRFEIIDASAEERAKVIDALQMLELDYELPDFGDDESPQLVIIAQTEAKADQFQNQFAGICNAVGILPEQSKAVSVAFDAHMP